MTEKIFETIISVLINSKIEAKKYNKKGINDSYIEEIDFALLEEQQEDYTVGRNELR